MMIKADKPIGLKDLTNDDLTLKVYKGDVPVSPQPVSELDVLVQHSLAVTFFNAKTSEIMLEQDDPRPVMIDRNGRATFFRITGKHLGFILQGSVGGPKELGRELIIGVPDVVAGQPWRLQKMVIIDGRI